jgi:tetratricopeptide (TPR) repeat protein
MDIEKLVEFIINGGEFSTEQIRSWTPEQVAHLVDRLKAETDRHRRIDPNISLRCADTIIQIGNVVDALPTVALGTMARGDTLLMLHRTDEAWQTLGLAGELYQEVGDEVGWGRTRIGRLLICVAMNSVESTLRDAETARAIFQKYQEFDKLIKLNTNAAAVHNLLAEHQAAIEQCQIVLRLIESTGEVDSNKLTIIYYIMGHAHQGLGNLRESLACYERTRELMLENGEKLGIALVDLNIINIAQAQGHHKKALRLLRETIDVLVHYVPLDHGREMLHVVEGYLFLNRFNEARDLARKVIQQHPSDYNNDHLAIILLQLAKAETALGDFSEAFSI